MTDRKKSAKRKLAVKKESLRKLSDSSLDAAIGGMAAGNQGGHEKTTFFVVKTIKTR
jgi:hypothetical protein